MPRAQNSTHPSNSTSSLGSAYFLCHWCNKKFSKRPLVIAHLRKCNENIKSAKKTSELKKNAEYNKTIKGSDVQDVSSNELFVKPQNVEFISKAGTQKVQSNSPLKKCEVCTEICANKTKLWLHIRKEHFNLQAKLPYCDQKKVNQVWFEKVLNCNNIMEIKKTGPNRLVMRKLDEKTSIKVYDNNTKTIDLTDLYPTKL